MKIRYAQPKDFVFLKKNDQAANPMELVNLVNLERVLIAEKGNQILGWLRWNLFGDNTPFMSFIHVAKEAREKGIDSALINHWESLMKEKKFSSVLVSVEENKIKENFYQQLGYSNAGFLLLPNQENKAIIYRKDI